jgi:hypothetical protein
MSLLQPLARGDIHGGENEEQHRDGDKQQIEHVMPLSTLQRRIECEDQSQDQQVLCRLQADDAGTQFAVIEESAVFSARVVEAMLDSYER